MSAFGGKADIFWFLSRIATCRTLLKKIAILSQPFPTAFDRMSSCAGNSDSLFVGAEVIRPPAKLLCTEHQDSTRSGAERLEFEVGQAKKPSQITI